MSNNFGHRVAPDNSYYAFTRGTEDVMRFGDDTSGQLAGFRNILINSPFQINNGNVGVPYVSGAVLAAGQTGHECWKAGASGGDYTFTQNPAITSITILPNKSLIQVIEDKFVEGGTYCISWTGTAKARVGVNAATPSGAYAVSPIVVTGQLVGVTMSVEFINDGSGGTFSEPQLEAGSIATQYEFGSDELQRTQRYFFKSTGCFGSGGIFFDANHARTYTEFPVTMRAAPVISIAGSVVFYAGSVSPGSVNAINQIIVEPVNPSSALIEWLLGTSATLGHGCVVASNAGNSGILMANARL